MSNSIFKLKRKVIRIINSFNKHTSSRHASKDYNILIVASLNIFEVICYVNL
jgi:hypothetical protein